MEMRVKLTYLLDTNTFSYAVTGRSPAARARFRCLLQDSGVNVCISAITEAEIRFGMAWRKPSPMRSFIIESTLAKIEILPWDSEAAVVYGGVRAALRARGTTVGPLDLLIAAHAASTSAILVTHDSIFSRIAEITGIRAITDWATDL